MPDIPGAKQYLYLSLMIGALLIWGAATAILIPAGEYPMPPAHYLDMGLDAALTILLAVSLVRFVPPAPDSGLKTAATLIGWAGVLGGLIQLAARFTSNHGWWTGHFGAPVFN